MVQRFINGISNAANQPQVYESAAFAMLESILVIFIFVLVPSDGRHEQTLIDP